MRRLSPQVRTAPSAGGPVSHKNTGHEREWRFSSAFPATRLCKFQFWCDNVTWMGRQGGEWCARIGGGRDGWVGHLELPLRRHDFCVDTGDLDASVVAGLQVGLDDVAPNGIPTADAAVVRPLRSREATLRPPCTLGIRITSYPSALTTRSYQREGGGAVEQSGLYISSMAPTYSVHMIPTRCPGVCYHRTLNGSC